jgi:FAD/FMN-containing dehydrogenase
MSLPVRPPGPAPSPSFPRRSVLQGAVLGAASLAASACTPSSPPAKAKAKAGSASPSSSSSQTSRSTASSAQGPTAADWRSLAHSIDGDVVRPTDGDFTSVSRLFNIRFDGVVPLSVVEAASADDVSAAVAFGQRFGLRSRPKAGGHSYVGASTVAGGLVIDVGRLASVHYDAASAVATVGAGAKLYPVHAALDRHARTIPTGTCPTVGAAGLTLGGGIGVASRDSGLTCDAMVGLTLVTADGRIRAVDDRQETDLFWACRGGGGGNFGIATSIRYATSPAGPVGIFKLGFPWSAAPAVIRGWAARVRAMDRTAWANLHLNAGSQGTASVEVVGTCSAGQEESEATAMEAAVGANATDVSTSSTSFLDAVSSLGGGTTSARQAWAAGSDVLAAMPPALATALSGFVADRAAKGSSLAAILDPLTGRVGDVPVGATAFPWRRALCDVQWYIGLPRSPSHGDVQQAYASIARAHRAVSGYSQGGYVNYLEPHRPVSSYYGANYPRLRSIKASVDPTGFFTSPYGIG